MKKWASFCSVHAQGQADEQDSYVSSPKGIPNLVPDTLARLDGCLPEHFDNLLKTVPKDCKLACQLVVLRAIPSLDNMTGTLTKLSQWCAESSSSLQMDRAEGYHDVKR